MNRTFTVSTGSPRRAPLLSNVQSPAWSKGSPSRSGRPGGSPAVRSPALSKGSPPAVRSPAQNWRFNESNRADRMTGGSTVPSSPVRPRGSFQTQWRNRDYDGSPGAFARRHDSDRFSRDAKQAVCYPTSPSLSHQPPPPSPRRKLYCHSPSQPRWALPRLSVATGGFQRHLSFDSSLRQAAVPYSPAKLEEEFTKFYHKFVCRENSALSNLFPCRCHVGRSNASRERSSSSVSALSALALSPHRSVLRKRLRNLDPDRSPQPKRAREWTSSLSHRKDNPRDMCFFGGGSRVPLSCTRLEFPEGKCVPLGRM
ncbi:hypothetical protein NHX12_032910 [Muraenolepis orangiensis]|uniref:Uncharacterized protein n=1 Tax=Muraenolepis orangiensis TaxID=630683 RepID=A0A9Q0IFV3_9TELE|nr:hypothetical protein NHX12_032910 [Muraenolepis orangiensis]